MLHFLQRLVLTGSQDPAAATPAGCALSWQFMAVASVLVPWLLYPTAGGHVADALAPTALLEALWPVLVGAVLALGLRHWRDHLPRVPEGDIVVAGEAAFRASYVVGAALERVDVQLRQWPAAGLALVTLVVAIGAAALLGR
jgi:multicomponent Na+:H+ antiporter subunit A